MREHAQHGERCGRPLRGQGRADREVDNGAGPVPSSLLTPVVVTRENIQETVVEDGFYRPEEICTAELADECEAAGVG